MHENSKISSTVISHEVLHVTWAFIFRNLQSQSPKENPYFSDTECLFTNFNECLL